MTENNHKHSDKTRRGTSPRGMYFLDFLAREEVAVERLMADMEESK